MFQQYISLDRRSILLNSATELLHVHGPGQLSSASTWILPYLPYSGLGSLDEMNSFLLWMYPESKGGKVTVTSTNYLWGFFFFHLYKIQ